MIAVDWQQASSSGPEVNGPLYCTTVCESESFLGLVSLPDSHIENAARREQKKTLLLLSFEIQDYETDLFFFLSRLI